MDMENDNKHPKCFVTKGDPPIVYQEAWGVHIHVCSHCTESYETDEFWQSKLATVAPHMTVSIRGILYLYNDSFLENHFKIAKC